MWTVNRGVGASARQPVGGSGQQAGLVTTSTSPEDDPLLKATEVAEVLDLSRAAVHLLVMNTRSRSQELGRSRRVLLWEVRRFITDNPLGGDR